jgi:hypothetical protein
LLQLSDDLVARTIADNLPVESKAYLQPDRPYTWNPFIFNWVARLAKSLSVEETCHHILTPLRDNWSQVPQLMAELLDGYISHQIAYVEGPTAQALEIWKEICNWVLDSPEIARKASYDYLDRDTGEVLQLIVFTLLNRIWNAFERQIRGNTVILQRYSNLVYRLVEAGIPLASVLRQKLEGRG